MIKLIILDFDGVIVESAGIKNQAFIEMFKNYEEISLDELISYLDSDKASSRFTKFKYIYENLLDKKYNQEIGNKLGEQFSEIVFKEIIKCPFVNGAIDFLEYFHKIYPLYIASNTPQEELERIIKKRNLKKYFKKAYGSPPGRKIDFIKKIIEDEKSKPDKVTYIGDMIEDYNIAKKTGVNFIGRKNIEKFDKFNVKYFSDLYEIKKYIKEKEDL